MQNVHNLFIDNNKLLCYTISTETKKGGIRGQQLQVVKPTTAVVERTENMRPELIQQAIIDFCKARPNCEIDYIRAHGDSVRIWYFDPVKDDGGHIDFYF